MIYFQLTGFSCFSGPVSGGRAVRILHEMEIDTKKLVARVDAKNKQLLDTFKEEEIKRSESSKTKHSDAVSEKNRDDSCMEMIKSILEEYKGELKAHSDGKDHVLN